jgi:monoamine oxidase
MESNYFVIVIGSGASGIAAAKYLHSLGKSYIVLEAMDRIGGRVWTKESPVNLFPIELGGEFLHGSQIVTNYISQTYDYSLSYAPRFLPQHMWWSGNDGQCFSLIDEKNKNERALLQRLEADVDELISINQSKMAFNMDNIDMSLEDYLISKGYSETEIEKANIVFAQTNCIHISELSVRELTRDSIVDRSGPGYYRYFFSLLATTKKVMNDP